MASNGFFCSYVQTDGPRRKISDVSYARHSARQSGVFFLVICFCGRGSRGFEEPGCRIIRATERAGGCPTRGLSLGSVSPSLLFAWVTVLSTSVFTL